MNSSTAIVHVGVVGEARVDAESGKVATMLWPSLVSSPMLLRKQQGYDRQGGDRFLEVPVPSHTGRRPVREAHRVEVCRNSGEDL